jgi:hypothetical protein
MKNCTPLWCEAHFQVKMQKTPQLRTAFGSCDVEKKRTPKHMLKAKRDHFWALNRTTQHLSTTASPPPPAAAATATTTTTL